MPIVEHALKANPVIIALLITRSGDAWSFEGFDSPPSTKKQQQNKYHFLTKKFVMLKN
jgi:hypothetical protein